MNALKKFTVISIILLCEVEMLFAEVISFGYQLEQSMMNSPTALKAAENDPETISFPYIWNDETASSDFQKGGMRWSWNETDKVFEVSGRKTNWGGSCYSKPISNLPADGKILITFDYAAGSEVTLTVTACRDEEEIVVATLTLPASPNLKKSSVIFESVGPCYIRFNATPNIAVMESSFFRFRNICIDNATKDMVCLRILTPQLDQIGMNNSSTTVSASFANISAGDIEDISFCYQVDEEEVIREAYEKSFAEGATLNYTFKTPYTVSTFGEHQLKVWCESPEDSKEENNTANKTLMYYVPKDFPYITSFDDKNEHWSIVDNNEDDITWSFQNANGNYLANLTLDSECDDYLVTPAILMPQGKSRISFYYGCAKGQNLAHLKVLMGTSPNPSEMSEVLFNEDLAVSGTFNGYKLLDISEEEVYYFAFACTGAGDQIIIDNLYIDRNEDLCIGNITFDEKSGFNKSTADVTLSFVNHGITEQKNVEITYFVNGIPQDTSVVKTPVLPGDTLYYTFKRPLDISKADEVYKLTGKILTVVGPDQINDMTNGEQLTHYVNCTIPYISTFEDTNRIGSWTYLSETGKTGWNIIIANSNAYDGANVLAHLPATPDTDADDWAFSECIEIPAGEYEFSFFYRTLLNYDLPELAQSFKVMIGTAPDPESMMIAVTQFDNITVGRQNFKKFIDKIRIPKTGRYYIGFHNYSKANTGYTFIDEVKIVPTVEALPLPLLDEGKDFVRWTLYDINPRKFYMWSYYEEGYIGVVTEANAGKNQEGVIVSPKMWLDADRDVKITVTYTAISETTDTLALQLFGGDVDNPDAMRLLAKLPQTINEEFVEAIYTFNSGNVGTDYFIGLRSNVSPQEQMYTVKIKSVKVEYTNANSINSIKGNKLNLYPAERTIHIDTDCVIQNVTIYDVSGKQISHTTAGTNEVSIGKPAEKGIYIILIETTAGITTKKIAL